MHQNYAGVQAKENYAGKDIDNFGMLSLFERRKITRSFMFQQGWFYK